MPEMMSQTDALNDQTKAIKEQTRAIKEQTIVIKAATIEVGRLLGKIYAVIGNRPAFGVGTTLDGFNNFIEEVKAADKE